MKINQCQFCDSKDIRRGRYMGVSFVLLAISSLGFVFLGFPWLPVTVNCKGCGVEYIAS